MKPHDILSAQVIMKGADGRVPAPDDVITAATIDAYVPNEAAIDQVSDRLRQLGFDVGEIVANSLTITAPAATFEQAFKVLIEGTPSKGAHFRTVGGKSLDLTSKSIPASIRKFVHAVTFTEPPDFGPQEFSH